MNKQKTNEEYKIRKLKDLILKIRNRGHNFVSINEIEKILEEGDKDE